MTAIVVVILRVIGLIWAVGAVFIIKNARAAPDSDAARWVLAGGVLTFVTGLMLLVASRWAAIPALLLVVQQGLFHWRQVRRLPEGAPRPKPGQVVIAGLVAAAILILASTGALI